MAKIMEKWVIKYQVWKERLCDLCFFIATICVHTLVHESKWLPHSQWPFVENKDDCFIGRLEGKARHDKYPRSLYYALFFPVALPIEQGLSY